MFIEHELIKPASVEQREYQTNIASAASKESTLVVLPTGLGKTIIALIVIADALRDRKGKALFMAPTKPLVQGTYLMPPFNKFQMAVEVLKVLKLET